MNIRIAGARVRQIAAILAALPCSLLSPFVTGCGGSGGGPVTSQPSNGVTKVTLVASSTADDQLLGFHVTLNSLVLIQDSGAKAPLFTTALYPEMIHRNVKPEPLATVSIPQGVYTSAELSASTTSFTCVTQDGTGELTEDTFGDGWSTIPATDISVALPSAITVSGTSMVLDLDMLVSQSATLPSGCSTSGLAGSTLTPTFTLAASTPIGASNGTEMRGVEGVVSAIDAQSGALTVSSIDGSNYGGGDSAGIPDPANGPTWTIQVNGSTVYQGISGTGMLTAGLAVDMDLQPQDDGSLVATRIAVYDANNSNLSVWNGPIISVSDSGELFELVPREQAGPVESGNGGQVSFADATFGVSQQIGNLSQLPFAPTFSASTMVAGQNVEVTFHQTTNSWPAQIATAILLPQAVDGMVSAISTEGNFTVYSVLLAPYDLFPELAMQSHQTTLLQNPSTIYIYVDKGTQLSANAAPTVGNLTRFYGLVFNDSGTLRMDCAGIDQGVAE